MEQKSSLTGPLIQTEIPGTRSQEWIDRLALRECPAITARRSRRAMTLGTAKDDPIVWKQAEGSVVQDVDGNCFIDLTAGFGVAAVGHRNHDAKETQHDHPHQGLEDHLEQLDAPVA